MARDIARWGQPIFWLYPREPDLQPFPGDRAGFFHGGGYGLEGTQTDGEVEELYGVTALYTSYQSPFGTSCDIINESMCLDGPERYRDMVRYIHDIVAPIAPNVTWVMGAITAFGDYQLWYPGNAYVDWHAVNEYQVIDDPGEPWNPFPEPHFGQNLKKRIESAMELDPTKPVMIVELGGMTYEEESGVDRSPIFQELFQSLKQDYPQIKAFIYFQLDSATLTVADPAAAVWQAEMNGSEADYWLSNVETSTVP